MNHFSADETTNILAHSELGKATTYPDHYSPQLLFPIARAIKRNEIHVPQPLPFFGCDIWNAYELSWLNPKGKPLVAVAEFIIPCSSKNIIESKSFKLYLNSLQNTRFENHAAVIQTLKKDLSLAAEAPVEVQLKPLSEFNTTTIDSFHGICLDNLDIEIHEHSVNPELLKTENKWVEEILYSDLLKSNCPITNQPDWGSIQIQYQGKKINHENLLKYIISFRNHNEFHEQCVERLFMDIYRHCEPAQLTVYARYTRRGGLDINPYRSTEANPAVPNERQIRQ